MSDELIREIKPMIDVGNLDALQILWEEYQECSDEQGIAWDYVFQTVYLHAALKKQHAICEWLDSVFLTFNPMTQIAMRQMFSYARYLLRK